MKIHHGVQRQLQADPFGQRFLFAWPFADSNFLNSSSTWRWSAVASGLLTICLSPRYGAQAQHDPSSEVSVAAEQGAPNPARFGDDSGARASTSPGETSYVYCRSEMAHAGRFTVPAKKRSVAEAAGKRVTIARPDRAQALPQHDRDSASGGVGRIMVWMEGAPHQCPGAVALGGRQVVAERSTESR